MLNQRATSSRKPSASSVKTTASIPNLDEITFGEFIDLEKYQYNMESLDKIMAILYRPIVRSMGDRYEIEPYNADGDSEVIKKMSAGTAIAALLFFYRSRNTFVDGIS